MGSNLVRGRVRAVKAGIIAAGLGERFQRAGMTTPKPLLRVGGRTLLERAITSAAAAGADEVALIVNREFPDVERYVRERPWPVPLRLTVRTTPSSMESFFALEPDLAGSPFLLLTVDGIHAPRSIAELARRGLAAGPAGTLGVTDHVDDEKPLRARIGADGEIVALGADAEPTPWVTSGIYFFFPGVYAAAAEARRRGLGAFRELLGLLLERGERLASHRVGTSIDVDRPEDLTAAERFVAELGE
jgi:NDP-sugar pyrophosphorylase family protein